MTEPAKTPPQRLDSIALERPLDWNRRRDAPKIHPILPYFITGEENRLTAFVSQSISHVLPEGNPILLTGPSGAGKTVMVIHLAAQITQSDRLKSEDEKATTELNDGSAIEVLYTTANDFHREYTENVAADVLQTMRDKINQASVWIVEDLEHIREKVSSQQELSLRLESRILDGKPTLLTSNQRPHDVKGFKADFCSRCVGGLSLPLTQPGYDAKKQIISELMIKHDVNAAENLLGELLARLDSEVPVRSLEAIIRSIKLWCTMNQSEPKSEALDYATESTSKTLDISLHKINAAVAKHFKLKRADLRSHSRKQTLVRARSLAMLIARNVTDQTMQQIGKYFGGRDHTTVLHALRSTENRLQEDPQLLDAMERIKSQLKVN
ncbi:MAG: DnaA/Hda family protein [Rubripirellula sp.]|nr:DnaA/Hda family protein [Rubripirellula sp.]